MRQHLTRTHRLSKYLWTVLGHIGSQNTNGQYSAMTPTTKHRNLLGVALRYFVIFHNLGGSTPLISRQVGFFAKVNHCFCFYSWSSNHSIYIGGGRRRSTPILHSHTIFDCFCNWEWQIIVLLQNAPLKFLKKNVNHIGSKLLGVIPQLIFNFRLLTPPSPLVSRQVGSFTNNTTSACPLQKPKYNHKGSKFRGLSLSIFFSYWGDPHPLISRQVGFFAKREHGFFMVYTLKKTATPLTIFQLKS